MSIIQAKGARVPDNFRQVLIKATRIRYMIHLSGPNVLWTADVSRTREQIEKWEVVIIN
ncbi:MAG: hypothetical protein ACYS18_03955 [Planctomycetota bacterium]